ncbi:hypothetical protein GOEFS_064_00110 [Gordonia effusa NBRC 100432]|uniref:Uncharacterized protein n=1 Tax=Gordonia effusa NBRC 100432 TaxID=1077974 RepID=H0R121_9ACTN|nr:hypothetical protein [Gordonia effusa]GAB18772.1 hypothetical protein GOEFS_064_00110 [Gordonia effusa NBRC 100432]
MSYDLWLIPEQHCDTATSARDYALAQDEANEPGTDVAEGLAAAISALDAPLEEEAGFLSLFPLDGTGGAVFVPSPWSAIQQARDIVVPQAFSVGYGVYDPQLDIVLDPREARAGHLMTSNEGTFPTLTRGLVEHFARAMKVKDFVIIETADEVYIQSQRTDVGAYDLEYRDGSSDRHFGTEVASPDDVVEAMLEWLAGNVAAYQRHSWRKLDLG